MAAPLCDQCSRIDFAALRGPSLSELDDLYAGRNPGHIYSSKTEDGDSRIYLGTLKRLQQNAIRCRLCPLLCHIIERQGIKTLDTSDVCFVATAGAVSSYFGSIGTIEPAQSLGFVLQRLTLTAHEDLGESRYGDCLAYLPHVLHTRIPGSIDLPVYGKTYDARDIPNTALFGARHRPSQVDIALLKSWIEICTNEHGHSCADTLGRDTERYPVRFIDVDRMAIKTFTELPLSNIHYVALSYVWGSAQYQKTKLIKSNVRELGVERCLETKEIPNTIRDAIELTKLLGINYLWVDALCIIQDDPNDQQIQINNMHGIYKTAFVTIVAASGEHSNAGLPGLRPDTRAYMQQETVIIDPSDHTPGLSVLTTVKKLPTSWNSSYTTGQGDIELSVWNRRAWTMQEKALSRRTITFSEEQVSWDCPCASFWEEAFFEVRNLRCRSIISTSYHDLSLSSLAQNKSPWNLYRNLVSLYSQRELSYPGDYSDAFAAVIEMMNDTTGEKFLWGLPCSRFNLALSWDTIYGVYRRHALSKLAMTSLNQQVKFPSWSWLGWVGHAHCSVGDDRTESESPTVTCYVHRSRPLRFLPVHLLGTPNAESGNVLTSLESNSSVTPRDLELHLPKLTNDTISRFADEYLLFFWAFTARLQVQPPDPTASMDHSSISDNVHELRPIIYNDDGKELGTTCRMKGQQKASTEADLQDFIAVGRRQVFEIPEYPAQILALQIEWVSGVAYRTNIAEIDEEAWLAANPSRILVALG